MRSERQQEIQHSLAKVLPKSAICAMLTPAEQEEINALWEKTDDKTWYECFFTWMLKQS